MDCEYGHGECKAPETQCPHWQGTFCELDMMTRVIDRFDKEVKEHPEIIEKVVSKYWEQFVDVKDVMFGDKVSFQIENPMKNVETKSLPTKMIFEDKTPFGNLKPSEIPVELHTFSYKGIRDCHKCVYEVGCHGNPVGCKKYKRDAPDGGYYG